MLGISGTLLLSLQCDGKMVHYLYPLENIQQLFRLLTDVKNAAVWAPAVFDCSPLTDNLRMVRPFSPHTANFS